MRKLKRKKSTIVTVEPVTEFIPDVPNSISECTLESIPICDSTPESTLVCESSSDPAQSSELSQKCTLTSAQRRRLWNKKQSSTCPAHGQISFVTAMEAALQLSVCLIRFAEISPSVS